MLDIETVSFTDAIGRILAEDVVAKDPLPPFPASIKVKNCIPILMVLKPLQIITTIIYRKYLLHST